ncbi:transcription initiation factor IIA subunit 1-like isoform X2 [Limulus polyphemus]|uniref:Transcription initiation factor IIA subunit 1-like isoform X2 n=1 Tax=Limulus polyphemus TaxID=6850 RepID=A0ABM1S3X7_LIMPO|nr:transcription initiation factor IIA subunit 1-like isoform X2 [Limulus polyphemus]
MAASTVPKLYRSVIEDVVNNLREAFLDEGVDEQVLIELKQTWEKKLIESKAVEHKEPETVSASNFRHQITRRSAQPQQTMHTQVSSSTVGHQLTLPPGRLTQPISRYSTTTGTGLETVTLTMPQKVTITLPPQNSQQGLQSVMSAPAASAALALDPQMAANLFQQVALSQAGILSSPNLQATTLHSETNSQGREIKSQTLPSDKQTHYTVNVSRTTNSTVLQPSGIPQVDGAHDTSDEDDDDDDFQDNDDDREDDDDEKNEFDNECATEEEYEPLNSEDDVSDEDPSELFETDNVVVCQYDKISKSRNRWKFQLKDGIMNLRGKDYVFQKAVGDAEW